MREKKKKKIGESRQLDGEEGVKKEKKKGYIGKGGSSSSLTSTVI